jgi:hypothetical protein
MRAIVSAESSPQSYARIGGMLYLLIIAAGLFAEALVRRVPVNPRAGLHRRAIVCSMADREGRWQEKNERSAS